MPFIGESVLIPLVVLVLKDQYNFFFHLYQYRCFYTYMGSLVVTGTTMSDSYWYRYRYHYVGFLLVPVPVPVPL